MVEGKSVVSGLDLNGSTQLSANIVSNRPGCRMLTADESREPVERAMLTLLFVS